MAGKMKTHQQESGLSYAVLRFFYLSAFPDVPDLPQDCLLIRAASQPNPAGVFNISFVSCTNIHGFAVS